MNSFAIRIRSSDEISILELHGWLVAGEATQAVRDAVQHLLLQGQRRVIFNVAAVPQIDSSGLGELVASYTRIRRSAGASVLLGAAGKVRELLELTQLTGILRTFNDEGEAVAALRSV